MREIRTNNKQRKQERGKTHKAAFGARSIVSNTQDSPTKLGGITRDLITHLFAAKKKRKERSLRGRKGGEVKRKEGKRRTTTEKKNFKKQ
jgi:hypothetical protein